MVWFLFACLIILSSCLFLHYYQHFRLVLCYKIRKPSIIPRQTSLTDNDSTIKKQQRNIFATVNFSISPNKPQMRCCLKSIENEEFDFYPFAYLLYIILLFILTSLILFQYIYSSDTVNISSIQFHNLFNPNLNEYRFKLLSLNLIDWIIIYSICLISIYESLFNFYRYYTTRYASIYMTSPSSIEIFFNFMTYSSIFICLFLFQIYYCNLLYILIVLLYILYNIYCISSFHCLLIKQYKSMKGCVVDSILSEMISSSYFMRNISFISCFSSTISLLIYLLFNDLNIIYHLPLLLCISCSFFCFLFARNRQFIYRIIFKFYQYIKFTHCYCFKSRSSSAINYTHTTLTTTISSISTASAMVELPSTLSSPSSLSSVTVNDLHLKKPNKIQINLNQMTMITSDEEEEELEIEVEEDNNNNKIINNKALALLGISTSTSTSTSCNELNEKMANKSIELVHQKSCSYDEIDDIHKFIKQQPLKIHKNGLQSAGNTPISSVSGSGSGLKQIDKQLDLLKLPKFTKKRSKSDSEQYKISISELVSDEKEKEKAFKHSQSLSANIPSQLNKLNNNNNNDDNETVNILNLLVGHGFYSRKSLKSFQEITQFQKSLNLNINK